MGDWVNRRSTTWLGWIVTSLMVLAGAAAIFSIFG
jgi:Mn2+/Fe2+ NRAMP family transporter